MVGEGHDQEVENLNCRILRDSVAFKIGDPKHSELAMEPGVSGGVKW